MALDGYSNPTGILPSSQNGFPEKLEELGEPNVTGESLIIIVFLKDYYVIAIRRGGCGKLEEVKPRRRTVNIDTWKLF